MKSLFTKALVTATIVGGSLFPVSASAAGTANFAISGANATVGNNFTVNITENGSAVNVVTTKLNFDTSKLQLLSVSCGFGSAQAETNGVTCYAAGGTTVEATTAAIATFKAVAAGSASISIADSSLIASNGSDIWSHAATSTNVSLSNAPVAPPVTPPTSGTGTGSTGTGSTSTGSTGSTSNTGTKATTTTGSTSTGTTGTTTAPTTSTTTTPSMTMQMNDNQKSTTKKAAAPVREKRFRGHHSAAMVTSWIVLAALVAAGIYMFVLHRRGNLPAFITKAFGKRK